MIINFCFFFQFFLKEFDLPYLASCNIKISVLKLFHKKEGHFL